jgi:hypothetical protein
VVGRLNAFGIAGRPRGVTEIQRLVASLAVEADLLWKGTAPEKGIESDEVRKVCRYGVRHASEAVRCHQDKSGTDLGFGTAEGPEGIQDDRHERRVGKDEVSAGVDVLMGEFSGGVGAVGERGTKTSGRDAVQEDGPDNVVGRKNEDGGWGGSGMRLVCKGCGEVVEGICELEGV